MSTYVIGDIHGCFDELCKLLKFIKYSQQKDTLLFTGDIINGGPKSIDTLAFIKSLGNKTICILGNHDLALLSMYKNPDLNLTKINDLTKNNQEIIEKRNQFHNILQHPDAKLLLEWLIHRPLLHFMPEFNVLLIHAGLYPFWSLEEVISLAAQAENILQSKDGGEFFKNMYGNMPDKWDDSLTGWDRIRFIINSITRMRFCNEEGRLELKTKGPISTTPKGYKPWFEIPNAKANDIKIIFGHWSALVGKTNCKNAISLDTGCIWGGSLSAMRLEDNKLFQVSCPTYCKIH